MDQIKVMIVDDHAIVRSGLGALLEKEQDIAVIDEAANGEEALLKSTSLPPDVILMDITLPDMTGVEAARRIHLCNPDIKIIALTMHQEEAYLLAFLEAGGVGYIPKTAVDKDVIRAIRMVTKGEIFLRPEGIQYMVRQHQEDLSNPSPNVLSEREKQVLKLIAYGFTCHEIGEQLSLSTRTVETYRDRLMDKLALKHRSELVEYALQNKILV